MKIIVRHPFGILVQCAALAFMPAAGSHAQSPAIGVQDVLLSVGINNKELKMNDQQSLILKSQYAAANALPDPQVSYTRQYGNREGLGINGELVASQSFDFPSLYAGRSRLARSKSQSLDLWQASLRRQILLNAKDICLDLIMLRKERELLAGRLTNALELEKLYARRLETGDANRLEANKISLELLNVETLSRRNALAIEAGERELEALNGGIPPAFVADSYEPLPDGGDTASFEDLYAEVSGADPELRALRNEQTAAGQALSVSRAGWLPSMELGYQLNTAARGERFSGFLVGLKFPVFSNRRKVQQARTETVYTRLRYDNAVLRTRSELLQHYRTTLSLRESMNRYEQLFDDQGNLPLLNKALASGNITMIEYFVEISTYYDSLQSYIRLENDYQKSVSRLFQHRLP
ncbi:MAG: TolC family protein [Tannerellaceae bacterium]|nr:TolC family protein [Tannerellaceae bacterium]